MEPLFFKAENHQDFAATWQHHFGASMEPLFFKAENRFVPSPTRQKPHRFNGAAFFQSGKFQQRSLRFRQGVELQWSRFFSKRKMLFDGLKQALAQVASMEPLFFKAENPPARQSPSSTGVRRLQWSRFFSKRKMCFPP